MKVSQNREESLFAFVPLCDGFVDRNRDSANSTLKLDIMSVEKTNVFSEDFEVGVCPLVDDELDPGLTLEVVSEVRVNEELQRVSIFRTED